MQKHALYKYDTTPIKGIVVYEHEVGSDLCHLTDKFSANWNPVIVEAEYLVKRLKNGVGEIEFYGHIVLRVKAAFDFSGQGYLTEKKVSFEASLEDGVFDMGFEGSRTGIGVEMSSGRIDAIAVVDVLRGFLLGLQVKLCQCPFDEVLYKSIREEGVLIDLAFQSQPLKQLHSVNRSLDPEE